jgi:hypothetical protein
MLDPKKVRIIATELDRLRLEVGIEERYAPVRAVRCLPLTQPERYIAIQDDEGEEIGIIGNLADLDPESRAAVEHELELNYLKARIEAITKVEAKNGIISWDLVTDRGPRRVHIRDRQNIRPLPNGKTILTDIHEAKYEIPPLDQLDEASRRWLETEL